MAENTPGEPFVIKERSDTYKLALLKVQLFTAMQMLTGDALKQFWEIIDEVQASRPDNRPRIENDIP